MRASSVAQLLHAGLDPVEPLLVPVGADALFGLGSCSVRQLVAPQGRDTSPKPRSRREHTVVAVAVDPRRRRKPGESLQELEWGYDEDGAAIDRWPWEAVDKPGIIG